MRILYLTNKPIFPLLDGGCKAMNQMMKCLLANKYSLRHICISTQKHPFDITAYPTDITEKVNIESVTINTEIKKIQAIKHLFNRRSYNIARFDSPVMHQKLVNELQNTTYDLIILESLFLSPYIDTIKRHSKARIILRTHNVEHKIWENLAENERNIFKKIYLKRLSKDLKKSELSDLNKVDLIATITEEDKQSFHRAGILSKIVTIPVSLGQKVIPVEFDTTKICFIGAMNWHPNKEALDWLIHSIFPEVKRKHPQIELHVAGSFMDNYTINNQTEGIFFHGFVDDADAFLASNGLLILPIKSGSGVRIKLLEAMASGIPVITTSKGAEGIDAKDAFYLANTTEEFAEGITILLTSGELRKDLSEKSIAFIRENYSVETVSKLIRQHLEH
jgi:glycosyltransferase involved in cell wall biosynthesis